MPDDLCTCGHHRWWHTRGPCATRPTGLNGPPCYCRKFTPHPAAVAEGGGETERLVSQFTGYLFDYSTACTIEDFADDAGKHAAAERAREDQRRIREAATAWFRQVLATHPAPAAPGEDAAIVDAMDSWARSEYGITYRELWRRARDEQAGKVLSHADVMAAAREHEAMAALEREALGAMESEARSSMEQEARAARAQEGR